MTKIIVDGKGKGFTRTELRRRFCLENFRDFKGFFWIVSSKTLFQQTKIFSTLAQMSLVSPQLMVLL